MIAGLLLGLWIQPPVGPPLRTLADLCARWADDATADLDAGRMPLEPALALEGVATLRCLPGSAQPSVLLTLDLHAGNVLSAQREPWLMIDPKPCVGDPAYDVTQHLLNCPRRLHSDPLALVARISNLVDLDRDRVRLWLFARCVQESVARPKLANVARRLSQS